MVNLCNLKIGQGHLASRGCYGIKKIGLGQRVDTQLWVTDVWDHQYFIFSPKCPLRMLGAMTGHRMGETITVPSAFVVGASPGFKDRVARLPGWLRSLFTIGWRGLGKLRWEIAMQSPPLIQFCADIQCVKSLFRWNDNMAIVSASRSVIFRCVWRSVIVLTPIRCPSRSNSWAVWTCCN